MARTQAKILTTVWTDPDWLALTSPAKGLFVLLLSQPRLNIAGCLDVMVTRWAKLSPDTTEADIDAALSELVAARYVVVDDDELVIRTFVTHDLGHGTTNGNLVKGMWSAWAGIMSPLLRKVVVDNMPAKVFDREGVEVPAEARQMRSEPPLELPIRPQSQPQSEPWFEPQSEPSVDLLPVPCSLLPATPIDSQDYTGSAVTESVEPMATNGERVDSEPVVDEQLVRKTAVLVGRAVAAGQAGVGNHAGYAHKVTAGILDPSGDGLDRARIVRALTAGEAPEAVAAGWSVDPFGLGAAERAPEPPRPVLSTAVVDEIRHQADEALPPADGLAQVRALRGQAS